MSDRTVIKRHPERAVPDMAEEIMILGHIAYVAFARGDQPFVIPFSYHYDSERPDRLYLHGSHESRTLNALADGAKVCFTVTLLDGLVYSKTAMFHSMNYRSVVGFGKAKRIEDHETKRDLLTKMVPRYFTDREVGTHFDAIPDAHLDATFFIEVEIEEWSAKSRVGGPKGPHDGDERVQGTSGVVELA